MKNFADLLKRGRHAEAVEVLTEIHKRADTAQVRRAAEGFLERDFFVVEKTPAALLCRALSLQLRREAADAIQRLSFRDVFEVPPFKERSTDNDSPLPLTNRERKEKAEREVQSLQTQWMEIQRLR